MGDIKFVSFLLTIALLLGSVFSLNTDANVNAVTKINHVKLISSASSDQNMAFQISVDQTPIEPPELKINSYMVQLTYAKASIWPKVEERINIGSSGKEVTIMAYQYDKDNVRVRFIFPDKVEDIKDQITVENNGLNYTITVPQMSGKMQITPTAIDERTKPVKTEKSTPAVDSLDEKYLQKLMQEEEQKNPEKKLDTGAVAAAASPNSAIAPIKTSHGIEGFVKDKNSSFKKGKNAENTPSLVSQMMKFIFFTALVLGIFYGLVYFMKRTVLNKGKLGFLGNANSITVLAQNYIAPKRSLMMVKVHNQVFLLSNCENGINFLSEISDTPGLIKQTVKSITGKNFDTNVGIAEGDEHLEEKVTLKEDIHFSKSLDEPSFKTKFAEQLKKKVKELRPLN